MESGRDGSRALAQEVIDLLRARGDTIAVAESLTGGMLAAALTEIPGASAAFRGGVVAYATGLKAALLGVPAALLDSHGAVHPEVARAMADGPVLIGGPAGAATRPCAPWRFPAAGTRSGRPPWSSRSTC
jgi:nicotinamide-nucleotide amidase